ncbi:Glycosyltransferase involved in cell wall bisynthesis [Sphingobium sp. AP50]|nr:Glycosyltransferase involved in cell wall bisynthesis [Sphingobium sp. AP50]
MQRGNRAAALLFHFCPGLNVTEHLYVVSSEWGGTQGGINVFNKSLVEALARVVGAGVQVCAVIASVETIPTSQSGAFRFIDYDGTGEGLATTIVRDIEATRSGADRIVIIGHDVHSGPHALIACEALRDRALKSEAALFCHMDYSAYQKFKSQPIRQINEKIKLQRDIVKRGDHVFAVGPLLQEAFGALRDVTEKQSPIYSIIPGAPEALTKRIAENPAKATHFFFAGRIDPDNDPIKNGRLALRAIFEAYEKNARSTNPRWHQRGQFIAYGLGEDVTDAWFCEELKGFSYGNHFTPLPRRFADQEEIFDELLNSHVSIMPSIHEGFGLAGWEAVCAGVPLICSKHTGLAEFLDAYFNENHLAPRESVLFVEMGDEIDIDTLSSAIDEMVRKYDRRRSHARKLAEDITKQFTWDACAQSVASRLGLSQAGPSDWQSRQQDSDAALARDGTSDNIAAEVERALREANAANSLNEWSLTCTALNYISDIGKTPTYAERQNAFGQLQTIADGIQRGYEAESLRQPLIRFSGRFDVGWRFMAAASGVARSFQAFVTVIPKEMLRDIHADSFLNREFLHYSMKFADEFDNVSEEVAREFFAQALASAPESPPLQIRFARLEAAFPELASVASLDPSQNSHYNAERNRCEAIRASRFDLNDLATNHQLGPTALALATLSPAFRTRGIDQIFIAGNEHGHVAPRPAWRGDKLLRSALLAAILHPNMLIAFIEAMALDEEEAIRWAAIDLAFSLTVRSRLFDASRAGTLEESSFQLKQRLGAIVDSAVQGDGCHPWMQREFLDRFHREHSAPSLPKEMRFTASDFPFSRALFGPAVGEAGNHPFDSLHPEVHLSAQKLLETMRRVLLVLPPISMKTGAPDVSTTSTPPLGLGMVGSHLLADGHDVHLADCHRTPALVHEVIEAASQFQWIGFNTVLPTMRSTLYMASSIKRTFSPPAIVVGGPAVNAGAFQSAAQNDDEASSWDFEINAQAETNFAYLVRSAARGDAALPAGIKPNEHSPLVLNAGHRSKGASAAIEPREWPETVLLDRRLFSTPKSLS